MHFYVHLRIQDHLILATGSGGRSSNGCGASDHLKVVLNDTAERPERCPRAAVRHDEVKGRRNKPTVISNYRNTKRCVLFLSCWWDRWTGHLSSRRYIYGYMDGRYDSRFDSNVCTIMNTWAFLIEPRLAIQFSIILITFFNHTIQKCYQFQYVFHIT